MCVWGGLLRVFFVNGCDSDLGTGNSKDTMREFVACPGYIANSSLLLPGPNSGNILVIRLQYSKKSGGEEETREKLESECH